MKLEGNANEFNPDELLVTDYFNGVTQTFEGDEAKDAIAQLPSKDDQKKNRIIQSVGLASIAGITLFLGLKINEFLGRVSDEPVEQQTISLNQTESPTPTATLTPTETPQPYTYQYPWIRRPLDGIDPTMTPTKPAGYYTNPDLLTPSPEPTETPQPYTYQYPWIRRPLDGIDPTMTPTKPAGYYTNPDLLTPSPEPTETQ